MSNEYSAFGLRVRSELPLPELLPAVGSARADVTIRVGSIAEPENAAGLHALDDALLFVAPSAGRYLISAGSEILVEPGAGVPDRNVRLYLLGSAFGALLHQRGLLPLHANAIEVDGASVAFMGASGAGKSTLAAWFHDRGHKIAADDVCVVSVEAGRAFAFAGLRRLRLWEEALRASGRNGADFQRSYLGDDSWNKFDVPVADEAATAQRLPIVGIYLLERGPAFQVERLGSLEATEAIFAHTYRGGFVRVAKSHQAHWATSLELVSSVPVFRVERIWGFDRYDEQALQLAEHAKVLAEASLATGNGT